MSRQQHAHSAPLMAFDRDGVINALVLGEAGPRAPWTVQEVSVLSGSREAIEAAAAHGFRIAVVTNQPDIARGLVAEVAVNDINGLIRSQIPAIEEFVVCPHDNCDRCSCRKPKPGMLLEAAAHFGSTPAASWMVGDRWTDIAAGQAAGFKTVLICDERSGPSNVAGLAQDDLVADMVVNSVVEAVAAILRYESD